MTAPGLRQIRRADGREAAIALVDRLLCQRCAGSIVAGCCVCRAAPKSSPEQVAAATVLTGERAA